MKKVLLISNRVFHYRQKVYNDFFHKFLRDGYEFHVISNEYQDVGYQIDFIKHEMPFTVKGYCEAIAQIKPEVVIVFLHLKDRIYLPIIQYCKRKQIPVIFWNKPVSATDPNNKLKNLVYYCIHHTCDALITYTPDMVTFFKEKDRKKLFIAYNTLSFSDIDKSKFHDPQAVKEKYGIKEKHVILYVSRMLPYKRPELLVDLFAGEKDVAVVFMGAGMTPELQEKIDKADNVYYLGQKYGDQGNEVFSIADVFSTPGNIGLSVNEAMFWGLPIVLLEGVHAPEIYYMKPGVTGYLAKDEEDFKAYMLELLHDDEKRRKMSEATLEIFDKEVSIDRMYQGFADAIAFCKEKQSNLGYYKRTMKRN